VVRVVSKLIFVQYDYISWSGDGGEKCGAVTNTVMTFLDIRV